MGVYTSDNALREKVVWQANGRRLSAENFDGENVDELIEIRQIINISPVKILRHTVHFNVNIINEESCKWMLRQ